MSAPLKKPPQSRSRKAKTGEAEGCNSLAALNLTTAADLVNLFLFRSQFVLNAGYRANVKLGDFNLAVSDTAGCPCRCEHD